MLLRSALILCAVASVAAAEEPGRVVIVKSADLTPYAQVAAGFSSELKGSAEVKLAVGADGASAVMKELSAQPPALVLAIGPAAAVAARAQLPKVPMLFVMVPAFQKYDLESPVTTGVSLTSDLSIELSVLAASLPVAKRVGILADSKFSAKVLEDAAGVAKGRGLQLVTLDVDSTDKVAKALADAKGRLDAIIVIADKTVGTASVVEKVIAWSIEQQVACVALGPAQVKQGALFAVTPSPVSMGQQAGRLANRILLEKVDPGSVAVSNPEGSDLHVNLATAKKLGLGDKFISELVTFAARQGLAVKGVE